MINELVKQLYFDREKLMINKGMKKGSIVEFDDDFYKSLSTTYINCLPVSIHIKYLKPIMRTGKYYDRSLYMFYCFDDAVLVSADIKNLKLKYGIENASHGWIELDNYVYDPSLLMRFEKELYYKIYKPYNIKKCTKDEYCSTASNKIVYDNITCTTVEDYLPGGEKRCDLVSIIHLIKSIASQTCDKQFTSDLNKWLSSIQYDEGQIYEELNQKVYRLKK